MSSRDRTDLEVLVAGQEAPGAEAWRLTWLDRPAGLARLSDGRRSETVVVEGSGTEWTVTLRGRRIPVTVRTWRERVLAEAEHAAAARGGPLDIKATLPGLVVAIQATEGSEVEEGAPLLVLEAMKMQNEVRAPRAGRVVTIAVAAGQPVPTGALLVRIE
ncbi:MAG TPA: biotin/lipoyl-containing protein [candidate division Zixibacteria bacterium]|nr:biotin/lipoyl-containing protein [candidate division Zixibacteria bacterium]